MQIKVVGSYHELSKVANEHVVQSAKENKEMLLCAATGNSPTGLYRMMAEEHLKNPKLFSKLRVLKLDEWGGINPAEEGSCESYLKQHLTGPLQIDSKRYFAFDSHPANPDEECRRISGFLAEQGPIDLCILGLGSNGHLALNEPAEFLQASCHVATLTSSSLQHPMTGEMKKKPAYGLTLGMADILHAKKIIMLITGTGKSEIVNHFLSGKISSKIPASFLWLHPNTTCLIDRESINL